MNELIVRYWKNVNEAFSIIGAPEHDDIHPEQVLGKTWYVIDDKDLGPVLLRGALFCERYVPAVRT
jgi:hypothetical protein